MQRYTMPFAPPGSTVGLLGGSFDPAHDGHVHLSQQALRRLRLDRLWWLVTPGNPIKAHGPAPLAGRMARARALMRHPRVTITDVERQLGTRYTAATLQALRHHYPQVRFVWIMGADNLAQFHRWDRWAGIFRSTPVAVFARPGQQMPALTSKAARRFAQTRLAAQDAGRLAHAQAPAWVFLTMPKRDISSTRLRQAEGAPAR
ncbi:nicotinate-nucleotide adenylyltransferase [Roseicitreum antarcticum]|uniref:Probable nicotinate-nucleotide adenylyltransferase n=1 Tax=Roseicitreum antarcticum TaxID=564137 RepID=A0A1H2ZUM3_9RHOB|nr:nicotinate-nucleotide adenylyltransferase [Roseicitreum antarcticum]SDX20971.1 nicotinate-nucleotide adenylyltransferase [Roseicitreum antarcticum]